MVGCLPGPSRACASRAPGVTVKAPLRPAPPAPVAFQLRVALQSPADPRPSKKPAHAPKTAPLLPKMIPRARHAEPGPSMAQYRRSRGRRPTPSRYNTPLPAATTINALPSAELVRVHPFTVRTAMRKRQSTSSTARAVLIRRLSRPCRPRRVTGVMVRRGRFRASTRTRPASRTVHSDVGT